MSTLATLNVRLTADGSQFTGTMSKAEGSVDSMSGKFRRLGDAAYKTGRRMTMGLTLPIAAGFVLAGKEALEAQKVMAQTDAVIKSTGGSAKVSAKDVEQLSSAWSKKAAIDDEVIQNAANVMLTFKDVRNEVGKGNKIFDRAVGVTTDMSVALGQDLKSSTIQIGKALNDPIKGLTSLRRVGVGFTEDQQNMIKWLTASGDKLGAQKIILRELKDEFGGSAKAQATDADRMKVSMQDLAEEVGKALLPVLKSLTPIVKSIAKGFSGLPGPVKAGVVVLLMFVAVAGPVTAAIGAMATALGFLAANPIILIIAAFAALVAALIWVGFNWEKVVKFFTDNKWVAVLLVIFAPVIAMLTGIAIAIGFLSEHWRTAWDAIVNFARAAWDVLGPGIMAIVGVIQGVIDFVVAIFTGQWGEAWEAFKSIAGAALDLVFWWFVGLPGKILAGLGDLLGWLAPKGAELAQGLWNGIAGIGLLIAQWFIALPGNIVSWVGDLAGTLVQAGRDLIGGFIRGAMESLGNVLTTQGVSPKASIDEAIAKAGAAGRLPKEFGRAAGGPVAGGQAYIVGEQGPEMFVPGASGQIIPNGVLGTVQAGGELAPEWPNQLSDATDKMTVTLEEFGTTATTSLKSTTDSMLSTLTASQTATEQQSSDHYARINFATVAAMLTVHDTMTRGAASAADSFVNELGARIPPLVFTLAAYSNTVKQQGRDFLTAIGAPVTFAEGGIDRAQIAPDGAYRVWAERGTGGEAYIPRRGANDPLGVLSTAASWYGMGVVPKSARYFQAGGLTLEELFYDPRGGWDSGVSVGAIGGHGSHVHAGAARGHTWPELDSFLMSVGIKPGPGSTTGGSHAEGSLHYQGRAKDYGSAANPNLDAIWGAFLPLAMGIAGPAGLAGVPDLAAVPGFGSGVLGAQAGGMAEKMRASMAFALAAARNQMLASMTFGGGAGVGPAAGPFQDYARAQLASFGWGDDQFGALVELWNRESGWNPLALNPSSGAWGIAQFLGAEKGPRHTDGYRQVLQGLGYIQSRYGSPAAALAFHDRNNWYGAGGIRSYDNGGFLPPGISVAYNGTGSPEPVGGVGGVSITVNGNVYADDFIQRVEHVLDERDRKLELAHGRQ